jgi:cytochrome c553
VSALLAVLAGAAILLIAYVYGVSEWKMRRTYDAPLTPLRTPTAIEPVEGMRMAKIVGCWAGCHGKEGEGGVESIKDIFAHTAPALSQVLPSYSDEELVRLIRYGVKRNSRSAIGMISYTFWPLGDEDLANIIAHLRNQPVRAPIARKLDITFRGRLALATGKWKVSAEQVDRSIPRWGERPRDTPFERGRYLASITCSECHGLDFRGNELEGGPSLAILAAYQPAQFEYLMRTGKAIGGRDIPKMSWLPNVDFLDQEIADLYAFLSEYHGLGTAPGYLKSDTRPAVPADGLAPPGRR